MPLHPVVEQVTRDITARSAPTRRLYLEHLRRSHTRGPRRLGLSCANLAHTFAACPSADKSALRGEVKPDIGIVTAYNDLLSAHQPYRDTPEFLKQCIREVGGVAQVAGGVPAMCDGITQGQPGMELSLLSREVIAMSTAVALSHGCFDGALLLGVCDKIVPGLVMGALSFGHLPMVFVPAGPMTSGIPNPEKARVRGRYAAGQASREELLEVEAQSYHGPGTCTFYGTANSNQMLMEIMGLHLPGASFATPGTPLREALTRAAAQQVVTLTGARGEGAPIGEILNEAAFVNGVAGLLATGGSTNHTLHLVAMAAAAGIVLTWDDFDRLSEVVPLLTRVYPNGTADINHFHAAGGMAFLIGQLLDAGLLHRDVLTVMGRGLETYRNEPVLERGELRWRGGPGKSLDEDVLRPVGSPFSPHGGLRLLTGNLGRGVIKVSAVAPSLQQITAPARVFDEPHQVVDAFQRGELNRDGVIVVRGQGPRANGMPELHELTPCLSVLLDRGYRVALVTDGRMSGASGKVPAAIHITPEAAAGGPLARVCDGDLITLDAIGGQLTCLVEDQEWHNRSVHLASPTPTWGWGRELFTPLRQQLSGAEEGATCFRLLAGPPVPPAQEMTPHQAA